MTFDDLPGEVRAAKGLFRLKMGELRDMDGSGKLGNWVRARIHDKLADRGLIHLPEDLPINQGDDVRLIERDSVQGRAAMAALHPSDAGDRVLRDLAADDEDRELLDQVRKLVGITA